MKRLGLVLLILDRDFSQNLQEAISFVMGAAQRRRL
jgi:hypothetical protein